LSQAVLLGGLFIGVLSALPIINLANCCCLWILGGGAIAAYLAQQQHPGPFGLMDGARVGFRAGIFGAVIWLFASTVVDLLVAPLQQSAADFMLRSATDVPPEVREWLENIGNSASLPARMIVGFFFQLFIAAPFAALGGLLGAAVFARSATPPSTQPPTTNHEPPTTNH
jgi:hypothetical protein